MPKITRIKYKTYEEFLSKRSELEGFGGSDIGTVMGLNSYKSKLEFFHQKIGLRNSVRKDSPAMYRGRVLEDVVVKSYWQYYDPENPTMDALLENASINRIIRKCRNVNYIMINSDYPWLFASLDREILIESGVNKNNKPIYKSLGPLEIKTDTGYGSSKWNAEVNPSHIVQHQQQLLVSGTEYGEIAILTDATWFKSIPFNANKEIQEGIINATKEFYLRIQNAKAILASQSWDEQAKMAKVQQLEPDPEGTEAWEQYMKDFYKPENNLSIQGTDELFEWATKYNELKELQSQYEDQKRLYANLLRNHLYKNQATLIDFGPNGKVFIQKDNKLNIKIYA